MRAALVELGYEEERTGPTGERLGRTLTVLETEHRSYGGADGDRRLRSAAIGAGIALVCPEVPGRVRFTGTGPARG